MARGLIVGVGSAGALVAAATGYFVSGRGFAPDNAPQRAPLSERSDDCIAAKVRLVESMTSTCMTPAEYESLRDRSVIDGNGAPVVVNLSAPDQEKDDAAVRTCAEYDAMRAQGWYALSGADMRREDYFKRACGALALLVGARPASSSNFASGAASEADMRSLASHEVVSFGEAGPASNIDVEATESGVWRIVIGAGVMTVYEIAHADFNGDGVGDILAYISTAAVDGTMRVGAVGFIEKLEADGACVFTPS